MPIITLEASHLKREQKVELVREFTATASRVLNIPADAFVVIIKENDMENIGCGGTLLADRQRPA